MEEWEILPDPLSLPYCRQGARCDMLVLNTASSEQNLVCPFPTPDPTARLDWRQRKGTLCMLRVSVQT